MLAGNRALEDYYSKHESVVEISHLLSAKTGEVAEAVERILKELGDLKFSMVQLKREYMAVKAEKMQKIFIPKESRNDTERFISVNGERILVQTGKTVEVPERFAEVIRNSEKMAQISQEYIDKNISL